MEIQEGGRLFKATVRNQQMTGLNYGKMKEEGGMHPPEEGLWKLFLNEINGAAIKAQRQV